MIEHCPMKHAARADLLIRYCAGTLDPAQTAEVEMHISVCRDCAAFAEAQREVWESLDRWEPEAVASDFDARLYQRIEQEQSWWRREFRPALLLFRKPVFSLAAASLLLVTVLWMRPADVVPAESVPEVSAGTVDIEQVEQTLEDLEMLTPLNTKVDQAKDSSTI